MPEERPYSQWDIPDRKINYFYKAGDYLFFPGIILEDIGHIPFVSIGALNDIGGDLAGLGLAFFAFGGIVAYKRMKSKKSDQ